MKTNLDSGHRLIRLILGAVLVLIEYKLHAHVALFYIAGYLGLTGLLGFCPMITFFKKG